MSERRLITLEYQGTAYCGFQRQFNGPSVQHELEKALFSLSGQAVSVTGASRTDAGVHALGQRAHFDMSGSIPPEKLPFALNTLLPRDIRVTACRAVAPSFHARFDARGKLYQYVIFNRRQPSALRRDFSAHVPLPLDIAAMRRAAACLLGTHDFAAFQAAGGTAKTTLRTLRRLELTQAGPEISLLVEGDAFLYNMVRILAGTLIAIGAGKLPQEAFQAALESLDRLALGPTAPAQGLTLMQVFYEDEP
ncbi:MAG: tRNA pseudouridine(38-40) synthase TruA [Christensenellales bacterium]